MGAIITVTPDDPRRPQRIGTRLEWRGTIAMAASYATGGDVLDAKTLGMNAITGGLISNFDGTLFRVIPQTPPSTAKLKATVSTTAAEVANATNQSALVPQAVITGR